MKLLYFILFFVVVIDFFCYYFNYEICRLFFYVMSSFVFGLYFLVILIDMENKF